MKRSELELSLANYYPFKSKYVKISGIRIHYIEEGPPSKPTILFLHGNPTWSFLYRRLIIELKDDFHCLALDYPGFGLSDKPEEFAYLPRSQAEIVNQFILRLGLDKFSLFVHDWGGPIGLKIAGEKPELIDKLVVTNTWAWPAEKKLLKLFSWLLGSRLGKKLIVSRHGFVNYIMPWGVTSGRRQFRQKILPFYRLSAARPTYIFPREINNSQQFLREVEAKLSELVGKPTLLLWGRWDPMFRNWALNRFKSLLNPDKVVKLSAGHYLMEDKPEEISEVLKDFLS